MGLSIKLMHKSLLQKSLKILFSLCLMCLVIQFLSPVGFSIGVFEFEAALKIWGEGKTFLHLPPLGNVTAITHKPPLDLHISLKNINLQAMGDLAGTVAKQDLWSAAFFGEVKVMISKYLASLLLLSFFLGMASCLVWSRNHVNKKEMILTGLINFLVLSILFSVAIFSYNTAAFSQLEYEGILEAAPWVLDTLEGGMGVIENLEGQFGEVVESISFLQKEIEKNISLENKNTVNLLHISDIHNNPAAFAFVQRITETFNIDIIVDSGDLVDYGTALEMEFLMETLKKINVPYIFIPGNHESPSTVEQIKKIKHITVLEKGVVEIEGLRLAGIADPAASTTAMALADEPLIEEAARELYEIVTNDGAVDLVAAHNPLLFKYLRHNNNLLLGGHVHTPYVLNGDDFVEINAGSTGASGIRGLQKLEIDFSLILLKLQYTEEDNAYHPLSADLIKVKHFPLSFSLERYVLKED